MNKKLLCGAMVAALGFATAASAQTFDDRFYITGSVGKTKYDSARHLEDQSWHGGFGVGKMLTPNVSVDAEVYYSNPSYKTNDLHWSLYGLGVTGRYHFRSEDSGNWWPYVGAGLGALKHEQDYPNMAGGNPLVREDTNLFAKVAFGLQGNWDRLGARVELGPRFDFDNGMNSRDDDYFMDMVYTASILYKLGDLPPPPVIPEPEVEPKITCADLDDDGDGVNNCDDQCPNTAAGTAVNASGCKEVIAIDLRGVNFNFDKSTLRPDAVAILDEAVAILNDNPSMAVQVAGHTDKCGKESYNQRLSERRAQIVYDYLTSHGVDASRLSGPVGYGETMPLVNTPDSYPACKSEENRRTELNSN